jgi:hypothetical protein
MDILSCVVCYYLEVGVGHKVPFDTTKPLYETGDNPTAHLALGGTYYLKKYGISLDFKYEHLSHWTDGWPVNNKDEWQVGQFKFVVRKYLNN